MIAESVVDEDDYDRVMSQGRWSLAKKGYVHRRKGENGAQREVKLHRFIMDALITDPMIDHIDRDPLNNSKANLRFCTNAQNGQNRKGMAGSSIHRGVFWDSDVQKWRVQPTLNGKKIHVGLFLIEEEAAEAAKAWRAVHMPFSVEPE